MNGLARRRLGKGPLHLTALGFGSSRIGNLHGPVPEDEALAAVGAAYAAGVRYFDTAPLYGQGLGEHRVGQVLRRKQRAPSNHGTEPEQILTISVTAG